MAVDVAHSRLAGKTARWRLSLRAPFGLAAAAAATLLMTTAFALQRATPRYFPDEFLYTSLARTIANGGGFRVLGDPFSSPAVLEPLLTSIAWLPDDPALAFRITQVFHAVAMCLAVVPVYLLARRLGLRPALSTFGGLVALLSPDLLYAGYATADAVAYSLALCAVAVGVRALTRPTVAAQALFLAVAALATSARLQYAVLVPGFVLATVLIERWSLRQAVSRFRLVFAVTAISSTAGLVSGSDALGRYADVTGFRVSAEALTWMPRSAFLLSLAAGVAVVPGAVAWLVGAGRSSSTARRAFGLLIATVLPALMAASALMAAETDSPRFFERYLMIAIPLLALAFGCWIEEGRPRRSVGIVIAVLLLLAVMRVPISSYAAGQGAADSPFLLAVRRLDGEIGLGNAGLVVALAVTAALLLASWPFVKRRASFATSCVTTLAVLAVTSVGAHLEDVRLSTSVADGTIGTPAGWVDATGAHDVLLVQTAHSESSRAMTQVFWNTAVTGGALLGDDAVGMDGATNRVAIDPRGLLTLSGRPIAAPLLIATSGTRPYFANAGVVARRAGFTLVRPVAPARLAALAEGLADDDWLAPSSRITVWPAAKRPRRLLLSVPRNRRTAQIRIIVGSRERVVRIEPGAAVALPIPGTLHSPWQIRLLAERPLVLEGGRGVAVKAELS
jgi:hypothetical protein